MLKRAVQEVYVRIDVSSCSVDVYATPLAEIIAGWQSVKCLTVIDDPVHPIPEGPWLFFSLTDRPSGKYELFLEWSFAERKLMLQTAPHATTEEYSSSKYDWEGGMTALAEDFVYPAICRRRGVDPATV